MPSIELKVSPLASPVLLAGLLRFTVTPALGTQIIGEIRAVATNERISAAAAAQEVVAVAADQRVGVAVAPQLVSKALPRIPSMEV